VFAALLGYNPCGRCSDPQGPDPASKANVDTLTGKTFFPHLISGPIHHGIVVVFGAAAAMATLGALVSLMRGGKYFAETTADSVRGLNNPLGSLA